MHNRCHRLVPAMVNESQYLEKWRFDLYSPFHSISMFIRFLVDYEQVSGRRDTLFSHLYRPNLGRSLLVRLIAKSRYTTRHTCRRGMLPDVQ